VQSRAGALCTITTMDCRDTTETAGVLYLFKARIAVVQSQQYRSVLFPLRAGVAHV
jgi:hypothetical protein